MGLNCSSRSLKGNQVTVETNMYLCMYENLYTVEVLYKHIHTLAFFPTDTGECFTKSQYIGVSEDLDKGPKGFIHTYVYTYAHFCLFCYRYREVLHEAPIQRGFHTNICTFQSFSYKYRKVLHAVSIQRWLQKVPHTQEAFQSPYVYGDS